MNHTASGLPRPDRIKRRGAGTKPGLSTNFFPHPPGTVPKYNLSRPEINVDRPEFKMLVFLHYH